MTTSDNAKDRVILSVVTHQVLYYCNISTSLNYASHWSEGWYYQKEFIEIYCPWTKSVQPGNFWSNGPLAAEWRSFWPNSHLGGCCTVFATQRPPTTIAQWFSMGLVLVRAGSHARPPVAKKEVHTLFSDRWKGTEEWDRLLFHYCKTNWTVYECSGYAQVTLREGIGAYLFLSAVS